VLRARASRRHPIRTDGLFVIINGGDAYSRGPVSHHKGTERDNACPSAEAVVIVVARSLRRATALIGFPDNEHGLTTVLQRLMRASCVPLVHSFTRPSSPTIIYNLFLYLQITLIIYLQFSRNFGMQKR